MPSPESPESQPALDPNWQAPDSLMEALALVARQELPNSFELLEAEIARVQQLPEDKDSPSYHETYFSDAQNSGERKVLFNPAVRIKGRDLINVIINDESRDLDGHSLLSISEFLVDIRSSRIAQGRSSLVRAPQSNVWLPNKIGPILQKRADKVAVSFHSKTLGFVKPPKAERFLHEVDQALGSRINSCTSWT